jgi:hypothetical protein
MNQKPPALDPNDPPVNIPPVASPRHDEALLDQAVADTFPASDPISPAVAQRQEPADARLQAGVSSPRPARAHMPTWLLLGAAAVALLALRALFSGRGDADDSEEFEDD